MVPDIKDLDVERIYLREDFGLRDLWELEHIAGGRHFHYYNSPETQGKYIVVHKNASWTTMIRLKFGR